MSEEKSYRHKPEKPSHPKVESKLHAKRNAGGRPSTDKQQLALEIEIGIYEVDKIFEGQGDKLSDSFVIDSLNSFTKLIKEKTYALYAEKLKEGSDDESDLLHINMVNRVSAAIEELELEVSDSELIEIVKHVLANVKKARSQKSSRVYLDPLAKRLKEIGFKSDFLTETDIDGDTISLNDIDNLDDLTLDEDDELDLDGLRPKF